MSNSESTSPHILLSFPDYYPDSNITEVVADFDLPEPLIKIRKLEQETYAAFEWTIPTVFVAYLGKTLFEALLKEAVKDYTPKLMAGLKALAIRCKQMNIRWLSASASTEKLSRSYHQSAAFSIVVQTKSGRHVKMLFDQELSPAEWEDAIDGMLATVAANYVQYPEDALTQSVIMQTTKPNYPLYVVYNRERKGWELHNDRTMLVLQRDQTHEATSGEADSG